MNVDFVKDNYRFNARASAIILNEKKNKILLFKVEDGRDYFLLPGGRIELYEDSLTAIKREVMEEYSKQSKQENFVIKENVKIMQYNFCYKGIYKGIINTDKFVCKDNNKQYFYWVDIEQLNSYKVYPESTIKLIKSEKLEHIIEKND